MTPFLTPADIAVLNDARRTLTRIADAIPLMPDDPNRNLLAAGCGMTRESALHAENAIFSFLSTASTWGAQDVTHAQLHEDSRATPEPQSLRA